jgi:hypothetical protein
VRRKTSQNRTTGSAQLHVRATVRMYVRMYIQTHGGRSRLFNRGPTGAARMQAWSLSRHVHDPACRLSFADAAHRQARGQTRSAGRRWDLQRPGLLLFRQRGREGQG